METMKKLLKSGQTLIFTSIVLMFAIFVYFTNNFGYGWFGQNEKVTANGIKVQTAELDSPIVNYTFYKVDGVETQIEDNVVFDTYTFVALSRGEVAEMTLGHYDKLERPTYHILLHISLKEDAASLTVDANINGGAYTIDEFELLNMVKSDVPIGLSSVMEFFVIRPKLIDANDPTKGYTISWNGNYENGEYKGAFIFDSHYLNEEESGMFKKTSETALSFANVANMFAGCEGLNDLWDCPKIDDDNYRDVFIFMTYNADRVNLLQDALQGIAGEESIDNYTMNFVSDFYLKVSGSFKTEDD